MVVEEVSSGSDVDVDGDHDAELEQVLQRFSENRPKQKRWNRADSDLDSQASSQFHPVYRDWRGDSKGSDSEEEHMSLAEHEMRLAQERRQVESDAAAALMASENDMRAEFRAEIALYQEREAQARKEMQMLRDVVTRFFRPDDA